MLKTLEPKLQETALCYPFSIVTKTIDASIKYGLHYKYCASILFFTIRLLVMYGIRLFALEGGD